MIGLILSLEQQRGIVIKFRKIQDYPSILKNSNPQLKFIALIKTMNLLYIIALPLLVYLKYEVPNWILKSI
ncbi:MAG: hypothetical protein CMF69_01255 [Magnetovibrio sp.]|nr:hypothetical protein [Magnetovibrio sp.]